MEQQREGAVDISHLTFGARVQILQRAAKVLAIPSPAPASFILSFAFNERNSAPGVGQTSSMGIPCV